MITENDLLEIGFVRNTSPSDCNFDEWVLNKDQFFTIGDFNGEGYLIDGIDGHTPINDPEKLKQLIEILYPA